MQVGVRNASRVSVRQPERNRQLEWPWRKWLDNFMFVSVHRWSILIIFQRDATQNSLFIITQVHYTCFGCQSRLLSGVHKTVTTASGTGAATSLQRGQASLVTLEGGSCTSTGGCSYSFVYSWWWVWLTSEICRVNLQNNRLLCVASRWTVINKWLDNIIRILCD